MLLLGLDAVRLLLKLNLTLFHGVFGRSLLYTEEDAFLRQRRLFIAISNSLDALKLIGFDTLLLIE